MGKGHCRLSRLVRSVRLVERRVEMMASRFASIGLYEIVLAPPASTIETRLASSHAPTDGRESSMDTKGNPCVWRTIASPMPTVRQESFSP